MTWRAARKPWCTLGGIWSLIALLLLLSLLGGCGASKPLHEQLADEMEEELAEVRTVKGRLEITIAPVTLQQELWVQRPNFLRTETESGPGAFAGTIVALNDAEGWVYTPALNRATVVDRSDYRPEMAGESGAGSVLERMPAAIVHELRQGAAVRVAGEEMVAGRPTDHLEIAIRQDSDTFPAGPLQVWIDQETSYPLAVTDSSGRRILFTTVRFNETIDPLTFVFVPPPGASVQRAQPEAR